MKLSSRLRTISDLVPNGTRVGDIGSDHGYVIADLLQQNKINKGIASDINEGPVENCRETMRQQQLDADVRLGGGFLPYKPGEIDIAIIAGMGGELIRDIFLESKAVVNSVDTFILQAMTGQDVLRRWLLNNNFNIIQETIAVEQDRFYEIMVVKHGKMDIDPSDLSYEIGFKMDLTENYRGFIEKKLQKYTMILNQIKDPKHERAVEAQKIVDQLSEVLNAY